jgi:peptide/nickel transport system ATP-binding protein
VEISGLRVSGPRGISVEPIDAVIAPGRTLAIIGESGSGKTLTAKALVGLLPRGFRSDGELRVGDTRIDLGAPEAAWRGVRGPTVALLLQDPFTSLSPVHRCGRQIAWTLEGSRGRPIPRAERDAAVRARLAEVLLPARVAHAYPHELSGGMRQRVALAAALACDPELLIADEPTTALDASTQGEILDLIRTVQEARDLSVVLISHDLGVVRGRSDDVLVMRHGAVLERGATAHVLADPQHPYTRALRDADPVLGTPPASIAPPSARPLLRASGIGKRFGERHVLEDVDLEIAEAEIAGVVGESGSGKSTLARCIAGLEREDAGVIVFDGAPLAPGRGSRTPGQMQMVFQDPYSSLNPMMTIGATLDEALRVRGRSDEDAEALLRTVGLPAEFVRKRPAELSGGERQRVAIARALAPRPRLLICDESVSALDVSVQAQVLELLVRLRDDLGVAIMFISHDLAVVRSIADSVTVLWRGRVVERGRCADVLSNPRHEYTRILVAAAERESATTPFDPEDR